MSQIIFFRKNLIDIDVENVDITVTDAVATDNGQDFVNFLRNRNNDSAWVTTGSTDAANTTLELDMLDEQEVDSVLIVSHNLKAFTLDYWTGSTWNNLETETTNTETTNYYSFSSVTTTKLRLVITGTQIADSDKSIKQIIITRKIGAGQLEGYPEIKNPRHSTNKKINRTLSGKINLVESVGAFSVQLSVKNWNIASDLNIIEEIYFARQGVLLWLNGNNEEQFSHLLMGYRKEDLYLVRPTNDYTPEFYQSVYSTGVKIDLNLEESID